MSISIFDLYTIGIGPSSSHTVGPMRAANRFARELVSSALLDRVARVQVTLYGSLALTGRGHGSDRAVLMGLEGESPEGVDPDRVPKRCDEIHARGSLRLVGHREIGFDHHRDLIFDGERRLAYHPNGMQCLALDAQGHTLLQKTYFSVGGGFVVCEDDPPPGPAVQVPHPFASAAELLARSAQAGLPISGLVLENEQTWRSESEIRSRLLRIWSAMVECIKRGCGRDGPLPGALGVMRRAARLHRRLVAQGEASLADPLSVMDWVNLYAIAVNEENAAGGRVVTAPTNGAAGIVPAVLHYFHRFCPQASEDRVIRFLLTAAAIAILYKRNASLSGADVGCQGEVGVASSMAAAGLTEVLGGSPAQVENAAEIAMEHNLGLTCDPVGGLVQIPCIERNAMGAIKAINACRIALRGDGQHVVSLDHVIKTMWQTGQDMKDHYKETSKGGLAVNVVEC